MNTATTNQVEYSTERLLYLAFELGNSQWKLGFTNGLGQQPRQRTIPAGNLDRLQQEIIAAKKRFRLAEPVRVVSCYEAGRDGFWLDRYLRCEGIENVIVDAASIEVNRRARRAKTDRLDLGKLLTMLIRYHSGEPKVWHVVQVPSLEQEDRPSGVAAAQTGAEAAYQSSQRTVGQPGSALGNQEGFSETVGDRPLVGWLPLAAWLEGAATAGV